MERDVLRNEHGVGVNPIIIRLRVGTEKEKKGGLKYGEDSLHVVTKFQRIPRDLLFLNLPARF